MANLLPTVRQGLDVFNIKPNQPLGDPARQLVKCQEVAESLCRGCEAAWHTYTCVSQLANHFTEGCIFAADRFNIGHA